MTNYLSSESNRKYRPRGFNNNGFYISRLEPFLKINYETLRLSIADSKLFEDKEVSWAVFNEKNDVCDNEEDDEGRNQVSIASFKKKHKVKYSEILSSIHGISDELVETCNIDLGYNIDPANSIPTILETTSRNSKPQLVHVDMGYDGYEYHQQLLCLFALQDNTYFRVVRGSHAFSTLHDLRNSKGYGHSIASDSDNGTRKGFMIPTVVTLKQGEFIVMHPKLFHSGWLADGHNIRLHFYFNLKQIKLGSSRKAQEQADTYIMDTEIAALFNGEAQSQHVKLLKASSIKKINRTKADKVMRFKNRLLVKN